MGFPRSSAANRGANRCITHHGHKFIRAANANPKNNLFLVLSRTKKRQAGIVIVLSVGVVWGWMFTGGEWRPYPYLATASCFPTLRRDILGQVSSAHSRLSLMMQPSSNRSPRACPQEPAQNEPDVRMQSAMGE
ncbi:hypothetical protein EDC01DRAFT_630288 [Geopyxis carbonaria]|nr:hypothetical protein EDC01DRAFT_630288 [Geopyxis carbonaria]